MNREGGEIVDFVVQHETPVPESSHVHVVVLRSDMTHAPHYDHYDRFGGRRLEWLPMHLSPSETIKFVVRDIRANWPTMRFAYFKGLR